MHKELSVVIQAGGESKRMGRDKGLVRLGNRYMIEHIIDKVGGLGDELLLVTNKPTQYVYFGLRMVSDPQPGMGVLPGLQTALANATGEYVLVIACDMPFLNVPLLKYQIEIAFDKSCETDVVVPRWHNRLQAFHAVYRRENCLTAVQHTITDKQEKMTSLFPYVQIRKIEPEVVTQYDPDGHSFFNVNTPEDLTKAERLFAEQQDKR